MCTRRMLLILAASLTLIAAGPSRVALAHSGGGGSHGGGGGGGGHAEGFHGGGMHGGAYRGGGYRGGGYRGGWYGRGYGRGWYGGGYYGWGLGYGLCLRRCPGTTTPTRWDGVPYYYADDVYYQWNGDAWAVRDRPSARRPRERSTDAGARDA